MNEKTSNQERKYVIDEMSLKLQQSGHIVHIAPA
jgi:hypothetical protein